MAPDTLEDGPLGQTATRGDSPSESGLLEDARLLWYELRELIHDRFRLAALETQQAGQSLVSMIVSGIMIAILLSCAWLGLVAAAVLELIEHGIIPSSAILLGVVFNLLLALILFGVIRRKSRNLQLPATLRSIQPKPRDTAKS